MRYFNPAGTYAGHMANGDPVRVDRLAEVEFSEEQFKDLPPRLQERLVLVEDGGLVAVTKPAGPRQGSIVKAPGNGAGKKGGRPAALNAAAQASAAAAAAEGAGGSGTGS